MEQVALYSNVRGVDYAHEDASTNETVILISLEGRCIYNDKFVQLRELT